MALVASLYQLDTADIYETATRFKTLPILLLMLHTYSVPNLNPVDFGLVKRLEAVLKILMKGR